MYYGITPTECCGADESRTRGLLNAIQALYQLSYSPSSKGQTSSPIWRGASIDFCWSFANLGAFPPVTPPLSGR